MSLFASNRERRLWIWASLTVLAIYSTLGLARSLEGTLRAKGLLEASFILGVALIGIAIVIQGWKSRPGGYEIGLALGIAAVYFMVFVRMANPAERTHLLEYSVVALLINEALAERSKAGLQVKLQPLLVVLITSVIGLVDECIQLLLPSRIFDPRDILFNGLASALAVGAAYSLGWVRRRKGSP